MKRTVQMAKLGANIPRPKGQRKNKNRFHELRLTRLQKKQEQMEAEVAANNAEVIHVNS